MQGEPRPDQAKPVAGSNNSFGCGQCATARRGKTRTGYELIDLRADGRGMFFVFRDRPMGRDDVLAFYGERAAVPPLAFSATIKDMKALLHNA